MRFSVTLLAILLGVISAGNASSQDEVTPGGGGMSVTEFHNLSSSLPQLPGNIQAIRFFSAQGERLHTSVALTVFEKRTGWQVFVLNSRNDKNFELEWKSGRLDDSFSVSSPDALRIFHLKNEDAVEFSGCAPHVCPDVFSILIYVPSKRTAFMAQYVEGKITYSPALESTVDAQYKSALDQLVHEHRNQ